MEHQDKEKCNSLVKNKHIKKNILYSFQKRKKKKKMTLYEK